MSDVPGELIGPVVPDEYVAPPPEGAVECPDCGRWFKNQNGLGVHKATIHGTNKKRRKPRTLKSLQTTPAPDPGAPPDWSVDDIFGSVVSLMWPGGEIPMYALLPLVRWRDATQQMLDEVKDGYRHG